MSNFKKGEGMRGKTLENVVSLSKLFLERVVKPGFVCVDATTGNGNDTLFLSQLAGENGFVYGFDVQQIAVDNTREKLENESEFKNYKIIKDGHQNMKEHIDGPVDFVVFNLGYLPRADKNIKTNKDTTLPAIKAAMDVLKQFGILWIVLYPGHDEGLEESDILESFFKDIKQSEFSVMKMQFINQVNNPPYVLALEKKIEY